MRSLKVEGLAVSVASLVFSKSIERYGMFWALRELGPRLTKFKSPKCGSRELKTWSLRADARRRITLHYQTQVRLQGTGSKPRGLGPSSSVEDRNSLACLPG